MRLFFDKMMKNLKNKLEKKRYIVLVDNEKVHLDDGQVADIILSPRYYWVKKENLPVKYAYQAKKYAASSFEGIIPKGEYKYLARMLDGECFLYAYDESFIYKELENLGLKPHQIGRVFFAQNELDKMTKPIKTNKDEVLTKHGDLIIKVPQKLVNGHIELREYFKDKSLSKFYVNLSKFNEFVDVKRTYLLSFLLSLLVVFYLLEFLALSKEEGRVELKKEQIKRAYKMPRTNIQLNSIMRSLEKKAKVQTKLRESFYLLTKLPLQEGEYLVFVQMDTKGMSLSFELKSQSRADAVQKYLQKHFVMHNVNKEKNKLSVEVGL